MGLASVPFTPPQRADIQGGIYAAMSAVFGS
jgi:hypothetical protein